MKPNKENPMTELNDAPTLDLSTFDTIKSADEGAWMNLRNPASLNTELKNKGQPISLLLLGKDSEAFRKASRAASNRRLKATARGRNNTTTAEDIEAEGKRLIIACTKGWKNVEVDGGPLEFNEENAEKFYDRFPAFFEQADEFIGGRENFLKA
jgi:DNA polymerase III alpha subunit